MLRAGYSAYTLGDDKKALVYLKNSFADERFSQFTIDSSYYLGQIYLKEWPKANGSKCF
ncbi:MAG: hypothetical protein QM734_13885 [Cyclobacteriaceae bacterium]